jgi:ankyrin repeat protein
MALNNAFNKPLAGEVSEAAKEGRTEDVRALLKRGADPDENNKAIDSPAIVLAAMNGHTETVRVLLDHKAAIDKKNTYQNTALMLAALYNHKEVVQLLIERGADLEQHNSRGQTALEWTEERNCHETAALLREAADIQRRGGAAKIKADAEEAERLIREALAQKQNRLKKAALKNKPKINLP